MICHSSLNCNDICQLTLQVFSNVCLFMSMWNNNLWSKNCRECMPRCSKRLFSNMWWLTSQEGYKSMSYFGESFEIRYMCRCLFIVACGARFLTVVHVITHVLRAVKVKGNVWHFLSIPILASTFLCTSTIQWLGFANSVWRLFKKNHLTGCVYAFSDEASLWNVNSEITLEVWHVSWVLTVLQAAIAF